MKLDVSQVQQKKKNFLKNSSPLGPGVETSARDQTQIKRGHTSRQGFERLSHPFVCYFARLLFLLSLFFYVDAQVLIDFVDAEMQAGRNVLIHCLAGAHRAGTAGVACLMYLCKLDRAAAVPLAKSLRPAIDPIGSFPDLLAHLDAAFDAQGR